MRTGFILRTVTAALLSVLLVSSPVRAIELYDVQALGATVGWRISEHGDVVGWTSVDGVTTAYIWTPEHGLTLLPAPPDRPHTIARAVSERAADGVVEIVGSAYIDALDEPGHAQRWRYDTGSGKVISRTDLGVLTGDDHSEARGVNGAGRIVGYSRGYGDRIFLHDGVDLQALEDTDGGPLYGRPEELSEAGVMVGYAGGEGFRWTETGGFEGLGVPEGFSTGTGMAINESGQVAGNATAGGGLYQQITRYTDGLGWEILGGLGKVNVGWGINDAGDVVGHGFADYSFTGRRGVIYTDELGRLVYIDSLLSDAAVAKQWGVLFAYDINDRGQIVGYGSSATEGGAVLLTPAGTQEPPAAPADLLAASRPATAGQPQPAIVLGWSDNSDNERGFEIERQTWGASGFVRIASVGSNMTGFTDTDVALCGGYDYRVRAGNLTGTSAYSNVAGAQVPCEAPDAVPLEAVFVDPQDGDSVSGKVTIRAQASDNVGVTGMQLYEDGAYLCGSSTAELQCTWNTRKEAAGDHRIEVRAFDAMGNMGSAAITVILAESSGGGGNGGGNGKNK
jgi:hypothetical protein